MNQAGFVFRPFFGEEINAVRISPNLITTEAQIDRFFETVSSLRS
jgi:4-aminobutyrate aminotransferase-like enzyme